MKRLIRWAISNTPAMNTLMVGIIVVGGFCLVQMRRELFPEFDLEIIYIGVPYPGASPEEVEQGICQKIEEAVQSIEGIDKIVSTAQEGSGFVVLELESSVKDVQRVLNEVRSEVDRITSFPELAEDPEIKQFTLRRVATRLGVVGRSRTIHGARSRFAKSRRKSGRTCCFCLRFRKCRSSARKIIRSISKSRGAVEGIRPQSEAGGRRRSP